MPRLFLFPTDGSEQAEFAGGKLEDLAREDDEVVVLNVMPDLPSNSVIDQYEPINLEQEFSREADEIIDPVVTRLEEKGLRANGLKARGNQGVVICDKATELDADYIVMGRTGKGTASELVLGSVSHYVIHHSPVPVVITGPESPA